MRSADITHAPETIAYGGTAGGADEALAFDQEHPDCLWIGSREETRTVARGSIPDTSHAPDGLPAFADGVRAARITAAVLRSASTGAWEAAP